MSRKPGHPAPDAARHSGAWQFAVLAALLAAMTAAPPDASAWGADGHRLIAEVAETRLSAPARAEIDRLLALEPGATLASISNWADEYRSSSTAHWHYVNLPRDSSCSYEPGRSCIQGGCVVHFVGDVHQPLHAGFADDRGGNRLQLQAYGRGANLHTLWDSALIQQ